MFMNNLYLTRFIQTSGASSKGSDVLNSNITNTKVMIVKEQSNISITLAVGCIILEYVNTCINWNILNTLYTETYLKIHDRIIKFTTVVTLYLTLTASSKKMMSLGMDEAEYFRVAKWKMTRLLVAWGKI